MTTTVNGNDPGLIDQAITQGTKLINRNGVDTATFERWESGTECAVLTMSGETPTHHCYIARDWKLAEPVTQVDTESERIAEYRRQVEDAGQRIADLVREKTTAEVRIEELTDQVVALTENLQLRTNERDRLQVQVERFQAQWDRCWERLGQEADNRDWCSEYDEIAEELGGPSRQVETDWSASFETKIDVGDLLGDSDLSNVEFPSGLWVPMTFTVNGEREGRRGRCVCESYEARERAQEELSNTSISWDDLRLITQSCGQCG